MRCFVFVILYVLFGLMLTIFPNRRSHYCDVIMGAMVSQITSLASAYSTVHSGADQRKHQSGRWPVNIPPKWPVTRKILSFDVVIMVASLVLYWSARDMRRPVLINSVIADAPTPNWPLAISSHHADSIMAKLLRLHYVTAKLQVHVRTIHTP